MCSESDIPIERIRIDTERLPVRRTLCRSTLNRLARQFRRDPASVPPILVWPDPARPGRFIVVSGCHRLEAARIAGATRIASVLVARSEADAATIALIELVRPGRRGSAWDTAQAMMVLHERLDQPSGRALAERVGRGRTQVARYLRVATELPEGDVREALHHADLEAEALRRLPLDSLYEIARSDDSPLEDRIERLIDEIRTRETLKAPASGVPKAMPIPAASLDAEQWGWMGIGALVALAGVMGFFL